MRPATGGAILLDYTPCLYIRYATVNAAPRVYEAFLANVNCAVPYFLRIILPQAEPDRHMRSMTATL